MPFEDLWIQLVDLPAIGETFTEPPLPQVILIVDLTHPAVLSNVQYILDMLAAWRCAAPRILTVIKTDLPGVAATGDLLLAPARSSFERFVHARAHRDLPPVVPTRLGADAGLVGAATLALGRG